MWTPHTLIANTEKFNTFPESASVCVCVCVQSICGIENLLRHTDAHSHTLASG